MGKSHAPHQYMLCFETIGRFACLAVMVTGSALGLSAQATVSRTAAPSQNTPPPDPVALLKAVNDHQKQNEAVRKDYIFKRRDEDQQFDSHGNVKSTEVKEYEVYFLGPWEIERLLSKDGKPLSEGERKKQDEEVRKQEAKARERIAKRDAGEDHDKNEITLAKFLAADRFYNLRRENYHGREVYAMDFAPRPEFEPHSVLDRVLKALGGTLWIDEQAKQGARLEARFLAGVKFGAGLLGSVRKGGNVVIEQQFVNGEVWLPSYVEVHLDAHVLFLHKAINGTSTYSNYRKFRVATKITGGLE
jgi:hypothetical protein